MLISLILWAAIIDNFCIFLLHQPYSSFFHIALGILYFDSNIRSLKALSKFGCEPKIWKWWKEMMMREILTWKLINALESWNLSVQWEARKFAEVLCTDIIFPLAREYKKQSNKLTMIQLHPRCLSVPVPWFQMGRAEKRL